MIRRALSVLLALCAAGCSSTPGNRYDFQPGPIAQRYVQPGLVRPPQIVRRGVWAPETPRGVFRALRAPQRVLITGETAYDPGALDPSAYLAGLLTVSQRQYGYNDVPAHYYVLDPGLIIEGRGEHVAAEPYKTAAEVSDALVVSMLGPFDDKPPKIETMETLADLLAHLCDKYKIAPNNVRSIMEVDASAAGPGRYVDNYLQCGWMSSAITERIERAHRTPPKRRR